MTILWHYPNFPYSDIVLFLSIVVFCGLLFSWLDFSRSFQVPFSEKGAIVPYQKPGLPSAGGGQDDDKDDKREDSRKRKRERKMGGSRFLESLLRNVRTTVQRLLIGMGDSNPLGFIPDLNTLERNIRAAAIERARGSSRPSSFRVQRLAFYVLQIIGELAVDGVNSAFFRRVIELILEER